MANSLDKRIGLRASIAGLIFFGLLAYLIYISWPNWYLWVKAAHIIAIISWMAGLLYLPRLFVYHTEQLEIGDLSCISLLQKMQERLLRIIMGPAQGSAYLFGIILLTQQNFDVIWIWVKLVCVLLMSWYHDYLRRSHKTLSQGKLVVSSSKWRMMNEIPAILMIIIVIMVVVKPI